jgi:hypothetical protein
LEIQMSEKKIIPVHLWTNGGGRALMLRFVDNGHRSYNNFQWPKEIGAEITAPDWNPLAVCGGGFHGWPWGVGIGCGKDPLFVDVHWQVISYDLKDAVWVENEKVKIRTGKLEYVGSWWEAVAMIEAGRTAWIYQAASGAASATGESGAASATGKSGAASATGASGAASATGWRGAASATGERGAASATNEYCTVECGSTGIASAIADDVTWVVQPGAVFVVRWLGKGGGVRYFKAKATAKAGERISFKYGKIVKREKP